MLRLPSDATEKHSPYQTPGSNPDNTSHLWQCGWVDESFTLPCQSYTSQVYICELM